MYKQDYNSKLFIDKVKVKDKLYTFVSGQWKRFKEIWIKLLQLPLESFVRLWKQNV